MVVLDPCSHGRPPACCRVTSHSVALLADTIHNIADAGTAIPLWVAFALARRKPTETFTYGYGRVEDFAGLAIVLIILLSALVAGYEAIDRLFHPRPVMHLGWLAAAGVIGFLGNEAVAVFRIRVGRQINSAALIADGYHARTDGLTSLAVVLGAFGVWMGYTLADPIIGLVITAAILGIVWQSAQGRADEDARWRRASDDWRTSPRGAACKGRDERGVRFARGGSVTACYAEMTLAVDPTLSLADARKVAKDVEEHARGHLARFGRASRGDSSSLRLESDLSIIQRPNTSTSTELPTSNTCPRGGASSRFGREAP